MFAFLKNIAAPNSAKQDFLNLKPFCLFGGEARVVVLEGSGV